MTKRALIVEDGELLRRCYVRQLQQRGYEVDEAATVQAALAVLQRQIDFALIICDFHLPDGTGDEVYRKLPEKLQHVFVLHTADPHAAAPAFEDCVVLRLGKPAERGEFANLLRMID